MANSYYTGVGAVGSTGTITINAGGSASSSWLTSSGTGSSMWTTSPYYSNVTITSAGSGYSNPLAGSGLHVTSDANIEGDLKVKGISITETLEKINERLAILVPDPAKLEKYAALKKAYEHYKTLEELIVKDDLKD